MENQTESAKLSARWVALAFLCSSSCEARWCAEVAGYMRIALGPRCCVRLRVTPLGGLPGWGAWPDDYALPTRPPQHDQVIVIDSFDLADGAELLSVTGTLPRVARSDPSFLRAVAAVPGSGSEQLAVLQVESVPGGVHGAAPGPIPSPVRAAIIAGLPRIAQAYHARFVRIEEHRERLLSVITPAQHRVVPLLVEGATEREIAGVLGRSKHTVHDHIKSIYKAWGVQSRIQVRDAWYGRSLEPACVPR